MSRDIVPRAVDLLRENPDHVEDARLHAGTTIVGAMLGEQVPDAPRWAVQRAVAWALVLLAQEQR